MITQSHLTAWQAHAPWPKRSQVEQDLRLSRGIAAIFTDPVLSGHLVMRGGTVLHKAHLPPAARYSEDIDLVLVKKMAVSTLEEHLLRVLGPMLGNLHRSLIADAQLMLRNVLKPSKILRMTFRFVPLMLAREESIKVEVNLNEHSSLYPLVAVDLDALDEQGSFASTVVQSYDINEMLGTKTRALLQRQQGRDLFDLCHAWTLSESGATKYKVDGAQAMKAFSWYMQQEGVHLGATDVNAALDERLRNPAFCNDMDTLLRPGLPRFDAEAGAELVRAAFFSHLSG